MARSLSDFLKPDAVCKSELSKVQVSSSIAQHVRFEDFEEHIVDHLASVTDVDVFGCEVDFVHPVTQEFLEDRIWEAIQQTKHYTIVFRDCLEAFHTKETFDGCPYRDIPKAVKVPANQSGIIPSSAFIAVPKIRHISVEAGIRAVGARVWQNCRHLRIVKMPSTVARIEESFWFLFGFGVACVLLPSSTPPTCPHSWKKNLCASKRAPFADAICLTA